jgi:hypothetical protein
VKLFLYTNFYVKSFDIFLFFVEKSNPFVIKVRWPSLSHLLNIAASSTPKPVQTSLFSGRVHLIHSFVFFSLHRTITLCYFMSIKRETEVWITSSLWKISSRIFSCFKENEVPFHWYMKILQSVIWLCDWYFVYSITKFITVVLIAYITYEKQFLYSTVHLKNISYTVHYIW